MIGPRAIVVDTTAKLGEQQHDDVVGLVVLAQVSKERLDAPGHRAPQIAVTGVLAGMRVEGAMVAIHDPAADLGSRIFYCDHGTFDTHAGQNPGHGNLWTAVTEGLGAFMQDLREHDHADNVIVLMFSEFGRRVRDNGSGTDHGAGGVAFVLGEKVKGGHYGQMPSLEAKDLVQGDLNPNMDFRSVYSTILDKWLKLNPAPIVNGTFEQPAFLN